MLGKNRKNKNQTNLPPTAEQGEVSSATKNKSKSGMSEFFDVSVPESALEIFDENKNFFKGDKRDGSAYYVGMMLHTETIGGFNKKTKGDADKGSIVEAVRGGNVDAYITVDQNDAEELIFIPNDKTFKYLEDFSILTSAEYEAVKIDAQSGEVLKTGAMASFAGFRKILRDESALDELLSFSEIIPEPEVELPESEVLQEMLEHLSESSESEVSRETGEIPAESEPEPESEINAFKPEDDSPDEDVDEEENEDVVYTEADVERSISRNFYSEGLNLNVSSDAFDLLFVNGNKQILFDDNQKDGFVDGELNRMAKNANADIARLRQKHHFKMREFFLTSSAECALLVQKKFDTHNPETECGKKKAALDDARKDKISNIDAHVSEAANKANAEFNKVLATVAEEGARKAKNDYMIKNGKVQALKIENLPNQIRQDIESEYRRELNDVYHERQDRAITSFDYMTTELLKNISNNMLLDFIKEEDELYAKYVKELEEYSKTLQKEDARRAMIEEERLRVQHDVSEAREELTAKIKSLTEEYEAMKLALENKHAVEIESARKQNQLLQEQTDERIEALERDKQTLDASLEKARANYASAYDDAKEDCKRQIEQARDDARAWQDTVKTLEKQYKHHTKLAIIIMSAVVIATFLVGFIVAGIWFKNSFDVISSNSKDAPLPYYVSDASDVLDEPDNISVPE